MSIRPLALTVVFIASLAIGACGDDEGGVAEPAPSPAQPADRLDADEGATLTYRMEDVWGNAPSASAQEHLVRVLTARLAAIGQPRANVAISESGELKVIVASDAAETAASAVEHSVELRFRIRAPSEIENEERDQRKQLGEFYAASRPEFAWFPVGKGTDVYVYVPEARLVLELSELRAAEPRDGELIKEKTARLQELLLQRVFTGADLADAQAIHRPGDSAVRVMIRPERQDAFREFTTHYRSRQMVVLVNGRVIASPTLTEPLQAAAEFRKPGGTYTPKQAEQLAEALRRAAYGIRLVRSQ